MPERSEHEAIRRTTSPVESAKRASPVQSLLPSAVLQRAGTPQPGTIRPADILALQRSIGNRAVQRMLAEPAASSRPAAATAAQPAVQRSLESGGKLLKLPTAQLQRSKITPHAVHSIQRNGEEKENKSSGWSRALKIGAGVAAAALVGYLAYQYFSSQGGGNPVVEASTALNVAQGAGSTGADMMAQTLSSTPVSSLGGGGAVAAAAETVSKAVPETFANKLLQKLPDELVVATVDALGGGGTTVANTMAAVRGLMGGAYPEIDPHSIGL